MIVLSFTSTLFDRTASSLLESGPKNMNKVILLTFLVSMFLISPAFANAAGCQPIYGGGKNCTTSKDIIIDKKIQSADGNFYNSLGNDERFQENDTLNFQITITNRTKKSLKNLEIKDDLPKFISFISGPGVFDLKTNTLSLKLETLGPNETKKYIVVTRVNSVDKDKCVINYVSAVMSNIKADSNSKFCLSASQGVPLEPGATTKGGIPPMPAPNMTQTPSTGPETLALIGLIPAGLAGLILRRKTK